MQLIFYCKISANSLFPKSFLPCRKLNQKYRETFFKFHEDLKINILLFNFFFRSNILEKKIILGPHNPTAMVIAIKF
jgi:hypothetical protein